MRMQSSRKSSTACARKTRRRSSCARGRTSLFYGDLEDDSSLDAASKTVQPNRLFLETCFNAALVDDESSLLGSVIDWFKRLTIVGRGARYILMPQQIATMMHFVLPSGRG